ncbi:glycosyltransferase family 4 protein [Paenibacillus sp. 481]|uniref:glycosyltransferase family 4 protein n=1 Tax=Paenibacillus sp. 481 TaxID=2835869 RepID=UPI001E490843|nr:glycosyltransferase family 4 protein [Paenibacillus sp. 481]UHA72287.1 glycosyltransferase family 4 protein [Paenibacillus sp. 481]
MMKPRNRSTPIVQMFAVVKKRLSKKEGLYGTSARLENISVRSAEHSAVLLAQHNRAPERSAKLPISRSITNSKRFARSTRLYAAEPVVRTVARSTPRAIPRAISRTLSRSLSHSVHSPTQPTLSAVRATSNTTRSTSRTATSPQRARGTATRFIHSTPNSRRRKRKVITLRRKRKIMKRRYRLSKFQLKKIASRNRRLRRTRRYLSRPSFTRRYAGGILVPSHADTLPIQIYPSPIQADAVANAPQSQDLTANLEQASTDPPPTPQAQTLGVNVFGLARAEMGIGQALRLGALSLIDAQIPITIQNYPLLRTARQQDYTLIGYTQEPAKHEINLMYMNPDLMPEARQYFGEQSFNGKHNIAYWHWELPEFPADFDFAFSHVDEVWVPSEYVRSSIAERSPVPVVTIPHGIVTAPIAPVTRSSLGVPDDKYIFLTMFDTYSIMERKNPEAVLEAFLQAFGPTRSDVCLIIKTNCPQNGDAAYEQFKSVAQSISNVIWLDKSLTRHETWALIDLADCFVSLHRAEGFGLSLAEAMSLGKPTIATRWSGNLEFMNDENSYLVNADIVPVGTNQGPYGAHQQWAQPSITEAAERMQHVIHNTYDSFRIGQQAQRHIAEHFSVAVSGQRMRDRLAQIRVQP